ncbi:MAG TPA: lactate utilization protein [bacterium]|nr:lactate utilization protein [bacterium]
MEDRLQRTKDALIKHGIHTRLVNTAAEAKQIILDEIEAGQKVGVGGSITIDTLQVVPELEARGCQVFWHWQAKSAAEASEIRRTQATTDVFLASSNAVTEDGRLVNIDGTGNRVAAMVYGPHKVILVCGQNKIVPDVEAGIHRTQNVAAPKNARRLNTGTPCGVTGRCNDCDSPGRMCAVTTIIERCPGQTDLKVILVREELGY